MDANDMMSALSILLGVMGLAPAARKKLVKLVEKTKATPSAADRKKLVEFCELLDQRRIFYAHFGVEVVECCLGSLRMVQDETTKRIAELGHPGARAMLEAVQDHLRAFMDKWGGFSTPRRWEHDHDGRLSEFFRDLGVLRERVRICTEGIALVEPKAKVLRADENTAPVLIYPGNHERQEKPAPRQARATTTVQLWLRVENNSKFVRGKTG